MATRLAALAGVILLAASLGATAWLLDPLPSRRGRVVLAGLTAPVEVRFDRSGIPHVRAILENDAWRALGFLHASDRLFQMELRRRAASGRLAEIFGPAALPSDRRARTLRFRADALREFSEAGERERAALEAYAQGVNAFIADQPEPLEMRALGIDPEPWTPVDSLAFARIMDEGLTMASARERGIFDDARARGLDRAVALADAVRRCRHANQSGGPRGLSRPRSGAWRAGRRHGRVPRGEQRLGDRRHAGRLGKAAARR